MVTMDPRSFLEAYQVTDIEKDPLPIKVLRNAITKEEIPGQAIHWGFDYLDQRSCPLTLINHILEKLYQEVHQTDFSHCVETVDETLDAGDNAAHEMRYEPLKLMRAIVKKLDEICVKEREDYHDSVDGIVESPDMQPHVFAVSYNNIKNSRRFMEDRMTVLPRMDRLFKLPTPISYFAVFDGHNGSEAAAYGAAQLHQYLIQSMNQHEDIIPSISDAFECLDECFIEKCRSGKVKSGSTVVLSLIMPGKLYVAWLGDSQAVLVKNNDVINLVTPHKPERKDEIDRIRSLGGEVIQMHDTYRVNGNLAVSRAIGDADQKTFIISTPDIKMLELEGSEEFLILACDGLWDEITPEAAAHIVRRQVVSDPTTVSAVSQKLVQMAKQKGSQDNISVIVVFLEPVESIKNRYEGVLEPETDMDVTFVLQSPEPIDVMPMEKFIEHGVGTVPLLPEVNGHAKEGDQLVDFLSFGSSKESAAQMLVDDVGNHSGDEDIIKKEVEEELSDAESDDEWQFKPSSQGLTMDEPLMWSQQGQQAESVEKFEQERIIDDVVYNASDVVSSNADHQLEFRHDDELGKEKELQPDFFSEDLQQQSELTQNKDSMQVLVPSKDFSSVSSFSDEHLMPKSTNPFVIEGSGTEPSQSSDFLAEIESNQQPQDEEKGTFIQETTTEVQKVLDISDITQIGTYEPEVSNSMLVQLTKADDPADHGDIPQDVTISESNAGTIQSEDSNNWNPIPTDTQFTVESEAPVIQEPAVSPFSTELQSAMNEGSPIPDTNTESTILFDQFKENASEVLVLQETCNKRIPEEAQVATLDVEKVEAETISATIKPDVSELVEKFEEKLLIDDLVGTETNVNNKETEVAADVTLAEANDNNYQEVEATVNNYEVETKADNYEAETSAKNYEAEATVNSYESEISALSNEMEANPFKNGSANIELEQQIEATIVSEDVGAVLNPPLAIPGDEQLQLTDSVQSKESIEILMPAKNDGFISTAESHELFNSKSTNPFDTEDVGSAVRNSPTFVIGGEVVQQQSDASNVSVEQLISNEKQNVSDDITVANLSSNIQGSESVFADSAVLVETPSGDDKPHELITGELKVTEVEAFDNNWNVVPSSSETPQESGKREDESTLEGRTSVDENNPKAITPSESTPLIAEAEKINAITVSESMSSALTLPIEKESSSDKAKADVKTAKSAKSPTKPEVSIGKGRTAAVKSPIKPEVSSKGNTSVSTKTTSTVPRSAPKPTSGVTSKPTTTKAPPSGTKPSGTSRTGTVASTTRAAPSKAVNGVDAKSTTKSATGVTMRARTVTAPAAPKAAAPKPTATKPALPSSTSPKKVPPVGGTTAAKPNTKPAGMPTTKDPASKPAAGVARPRPKPTTITTSTLPKSAVGSEVKKPTAMKPSAPSTKPTTTSLTKPPTARNVPMSSRTAAPAKPITATTRPTANRNVPKPTGAATDSGKPSGTSVTRTTTRTNAVSTTKAAGVNKKPDSTIMKTKKPSPTALGKVESATKSAKSTINKKVATATNEKAELIQQNGINSTEGIGDVKELSGVNGGLNGDLNSVNGETEKQDAIKENGVHLDDETVISNNTSPPVPSTPIENLLG